MTSRRRADPGPADWRGTLGRLALRLADQMLGADARPAANRSRQAERGSERPPVEQAPDEQSAAGAAQALEHALTQFESVLGRMEQRSAPQAAPEEGRIAEAGPFASLQEFDEPPAGLDEILAGLEDEASEEQEPDRNVMDAHELNELRRMVREVARRLEDAIDRFDSEGQRLVDQTERLAQIAARLEDKLNDLSVAAPAHPQAQPSTQAPAANEPQFGPGNGPVDVVLAGVPGFQGLMEVQRALSGLPSSERASVVAYKNGEASIEVQLLAPMSAQQIVEGLRSATGHRLLIEEARPESNRLRLRFIEDGG